LCRLWTWIGRNIILKPANFFAEPASSEGQGIFCFMGGGSGCGGWKPDAVILRISGWHQGQGAGWLSAGQLLVLVRAMLHAMILKKMKRDESIFIICPQI